MMSVGSLVAAGILSFLKLETDHTVPGSSRAAGEGNGNAGARPIVSVRR